MSGALKKLVALVLLVVAITVVAALCSIRLARLESVEEYEALVAAHVGKLVGVDENEYVKVTLGFSPHAGEEKLLLLHYFVKKELPHPSFSTSLVNPQTGQDLLGRNRSWDKVEPHHLGVIRYRCRKIQSDVIDLSKAKPGDPVRLTFGAGQSLVSTEGGVTSYTSQPPLVKSVFEFVAP